MSERFDERLRRMETDTPDLVRYWFEFDLASDLPEREPGHIQLDGGAVAYRLLSRGAGVTGYDEADCLYLLQDVLGNDLPPRLRSERNPSIDDRLAQEVGNVAWRGVWFPPMNISGPVIG
jgi:hypothetical protein